MLVRHEQGAGHAATGYAQATGKVGVCMATSGPGRDQPGDPAGRRAHGLGADRRDHRAGAQRRHRHRRLPGSRHPRHHDAGDQAQLPGHRRRRDPAADRRGLPPAPAPAGPGPVLVDIPKDVLQATTDFSWPPRLDLPGYKPTTRPHGKQVREAAALIAAARRPVLYVGGGVLKAQASAELAELAELTGAPVVTTLMARGAFPDSHPQNLGMPGMHGNVTAVTALQKADVLVALGARFDDRVTGNLASFAPGRARRARRHRPGRDRQEPQGRRADRGRRQGDDHAADRGAARRPRGRPHARPVRLVGPARRLAGALPARLRLARGRLAVAAVRHRAARRDRRPGRRSTPPASASTRCGPRSS